MTAQDAPAMLRCRYRYATGCQATYGSQPGLRIHEKESAAHELHRVELRSCPECGDDLGTEAERAMHLSNVHGIRARSAERQEADARQVQALFDASGNGALAPLPGGASMVLRADAEPAPASPAAISAPAVPSPDGHSAAGLAAAPDAFAALGALLTENERLRAENAELAARLDQVRSALAG